MGSAYRQGNP